MTGESHTQDLLFEVLTTLGFWVWVKHDYWDLIIKIKHSIMAGREADVKETLAYSEEIRLSRSDPNVYLFYKTEYIGR